MGCFSSKVAARTGSFKEDWSQSLQRRIKGFPLLDDIIVSKNTTDQLHPVVCTANLDEKNLRTSDSAPPVEIINTWELMADLEEQEEETTHLPHCSQSFHLFNSGKEGVEKEKLSRSRSFPTVEECGAVLAGEGDKDSSFKPEKGLQRKTMARQLSALVIPPSVEFPALGSLPVLSPESAAGDYVTPRFGRFGRPAAGGGPAFDPELVAEMEEELEEMTAAEELLVGEMVAALAGGGGEEDYDGGPINGPK